MNFYKNKEMLAQYVEEVLKLLEPNCVLTMTIIPWPLGGFSVRIVIEELSGDIEKKMLDSSWQPINT